MNSLNEMRTSCPLPWSTLCYFTIVSALEVLKRLCTFQHLLGCCHVWPWVEILQHKEASCGWDLLEVVRWPTSLDQKDFVSGLDKPPGHGWTCRSSSHHDEIETLVGSQSCFCTSWPIFGHFQIIGNIHLSQQLSQRTPSVIPKVLQKVSLPS